MKYDSYSRFLKSKLYQDCVLAEMGGLPLPISLEKAENELELSVSSELGGSGGMEDSMTEKNGGLTTSGTVKEKLERKRSDKKGDKKVRQSRQIDDCLTS